VNEGQEEGDKEPNHNPMLGLAFLVCFFFLKEFADEEEQEGMRNQTAVQKGDRTGHHFKQNSDRYKIIAKMPKD
jgi:hypothetical protein